MDFNSLRKEINSKNASVTELINDIFMKIDSNILIIREINNYTLIEREEKDKCVIIASKFCICLVTREYI